jgi:uncharacterized protein
VLLLAQGTPPKKLNISLSHIVHDGTILLRWVPMDYDTWKWANKMGYHVERMTIERNGQKLSIADQYQSLVIIEDKLLPFEEGTFEKMAQNIPMAGVAGAALYSTDFNVTTSVGDSGWVKAKNQVMERENRYGYCLYAADQSPEVARAVALMAVDNNIDNSERYRYVDKIPINRGFAFVDPNEVSTLPVIQNFEGEGGDKMARLRWRKDNLDKFFCSYIIEKSENLSGPFLPIPGTNIAAITNQLNEPYSYFTDSLAENKKSYFYRIYGRSPFGLLSDPSSPIEVVGKPPFLENAQPFVKNTTEVTKGLLRLIWDFPVALEYKIKGFDVYRSETVSGTFSKINTQRLTPTQRFYEDPTLKSAAYYVIKTIDENDYEIPSMTVLGQLKDDTPPAKPLGIQCSATKEGKVTITWTKNEEEDLKGYRVFFSNNEQTDFSQLTATPVQGNVFEYDIPMNVLNEHIYYKLFALDYHENNSVYSDVCPMKRPDVIPPSEPVLFQALATYDGVQLKWHKSSSNDVIRHELQRKISYNVDWEIINNTGIEAFTDITANKNYFYDYRILAFDDDDNVASSDILTARPIYDGQIQAVGDANLTKPKSLIEENIDVAKYFNPNKVVLSWAYTKGSTTETFVLYRAGPDGASRKLIAQLPINGATLSYSYTDKAVVVGKIYVYDVEICSQGTGCQPFGEPQSVFFRPKGGNPQNFGRFATTHHTNYNNKGKFPYQSALMYFNMGAEIPNQHSLEIYRRGLYEQPKILARLNQNDTKWFWADYATAPNNEYVYEYKVCDNVSNLCRWSEMQTYVQYYTEPGYSTTHNYLPNYVQVQFGCDGTAPNTYYLVTKSLTK